MVRIYATLCANDQPCDSQLTTHDYHFTQDSDATQRPTLKCGKPTTDYRLPVLTVLQVLLDLVHKHRVNRFLHLCENVQHAVELGYLDELIGVV